MPTRIHVVAGVLRDDSGRVLVAQRPAGKHLAGLWEFPGGKVDPGEQRTDALRRELHEELGIDIGRVQPLIRVPHRYPELHVDLDVFTVDEWQGDIHAGEGQALAWHSLEQLQQLPMPAADRPVLDALRLPPHYAITPRHDSAAVDALLNAARRRLQGGLRLLQLRQPHWPQAILANAAQRLQMLCREHGAVLMMNRHWHLVGELGLDGAHLPAAVAAQLESRPLAEDRWLAVSCHDEAELAQAVRIGADFVTLSPVQATASHPGQPGLGWGAFARLAADCPLPVYALGGLTPADLAQAREMGGQGIAAIRGLWHS